MARNALESNNYVTFARNGICPFAVGGKVGVVPKDLRLRVWTWRGWGWGCTR